MLPEMVIYRFEVIFTELYVLKYIYLNIITFILFTLFESVTL